MVEPDVDRIQLEVLGVEGTVDLLQPCHTLCQVGIGRIVQRPRFGRGLVWLLLVGRPVLEYLQSVDDDRRRPTGDAVRVVVDPRLEPAVAVALGIPACRR